MTRPKRDPYLDVCETARDAIDRALTAQLTARQLRTLLAVLHYTALRSYLATDVWLAQIAATSHGVDQATEWQLDKTRADMKALQAAGVLTYQPPTGRTRRPGYHISLTPPDPRGGSHTSSPTQIGGGSHTSSPTQIGGGSHKDNPHSDRRGITRQHPPPIPEDIPLRSRKDIPLRSRKSSPSDLSGPTEEISEGLPEEDLRGGADAAPTGTGSAGPSDDDDAGREAAQETPDLPPFHIPPEWADDPNPDDDRLTRHLDHHAARRPGPQADADAIDTHLRTHLGQTERDILASRLDTTPPTDIRQILADARHLADELGLDLPRLTLPRRRTP